MIISSGIFFIIIETDPKNYFPKSHPIVYATNLVNDNLGGSQNISVVYKGDIKDPRIMKKIDRMEKDLEKFPEVGLTTSIARVIRQMSRALFDEGEENYDRIPDSRDAVVLIRVLLMILFRSIAAGLIATVPLGVSIVTLFGLMGILSIELNVAVAMLSSIMIGVGVDYTIHFLWRYREERQQGERAHQGDRHGIQAL